MIKANKKETLIKGTTEELIENLSNVFLGIIMNKNFSHLRLILYKSVDRAKEKLKEFRIEEEEIF